MHSVPPPPVTGVEVKRVSYAGICNAQNIQNVRVVQPVQVRVVQIKENAPSGSSSSSAGSNKPKRPRIHQRSQRRHPIDDNEDENEDGIDDEFYSAPQRRQTLAEFDEEMRRDREAFYKSGRKDIDQLFKNARDYPDDLSLMRVALAREADLEELLNKQEDRDFHFSAISRYS